MRKELYICTKPLQYFNIKNIVDESFSCRVLLIKGNFLDAKLFSDLVRTNDKIWDRVLYTDDTKGFYVYIIKENADILYIDNDSSGFYALYSILLNKRVFVYEEGYGTYRRAAIKESVGKYKFLLYKLMGIDKQIGNARFVKGVYLYLPGLYKNLYPNYKKEIRKFNKPFMLALRESASLFMSLSGNVGKLELIRNRSILVYLTSHSLNERILTYLEIESSRYDCVYIKPHPHVKSIDITSSVQVSIINSNVMMEFLLLILLDNGNKITVVHENSTSIIWFQNLVECINMGVDFPEYNAVVSYIRANEL